MSTPTHTWQQELEVVDRTMRAISGVVDPEELVDVYWNGIGELLPYREYLSVSRRHESAPSFVVTRSSRFTEHHNPWTDRDRLPRLSGGLVGELAYANRPVIIEDLPSRLERDDPAWFYLQGFGSLVSFPQYDNGEALNINIMLMPPGVPLDSRRIPTMHWQSGLFGRGTQNLVLRNQLGAALAALDGELRVVGEIQRSLLPQGLPAIRGFDLAADYRTSARAGGDYYDFFPLRDGRWTVLIADVSGHGTPAAVLMAVTRALAHAPGAVGGGERLHESPGALLGYLNEQLVRSYTRGGEFVTAFAAVLDPRSGTLTCASAGHNPPRLHRAGGAFGVESVGGLPLGIVDGQVYQESTLRLERGDLLLLYTDGITEAGESPGARAAASPRRMSLFGTDRLDAALRGCDDGSAAGCVRRIREALREFSGDAAAADDQTLVALRYI